jgi:hypothetical protein
VTAAALARRGLLAGSIEHRLGEIETHDLTAGTLFGKGE